MGIDNSLSKHNSQLENKDRRIIFCIDDYTLPEDWTVKQIWKIRKKWVGIHYHEWVTQKCSKIKEWTLSGSIFNWSWAFAYMISNVSDEDKFSEWYKNCTWIIMIWKDKYTWKNISFMTHQDPKMFLKHKDEFEADLKNKIEEITEKCIPWSTDVIIFWGQDYDELEFKEYKASVNLLNRIITRKLGKSPEVILWPKINSSEPLNAYFNTKLRRLYIIRWESDFPETNISFLAKDVNKYIKYVKEVVECYIEEDL